MSARLAPISVLARLLGVLAMLGVVAVHGLVVPGAGHDGTSMAGMSMGATTSVARTASTTPTSASAQRAVRVAPFSPVPADGGAGCPMTDHAPSAAPADCPGMTAPAAPGDVSLAAPAASHLLPPAALPQWPSPRAATFAPPAATPTHVILRT